MNAHQQWMNCSWYGVVESLCEVFLYDGSIWISRRRLWQEQQQAIWWYVMMPVEWRIVILTRELVDDDDVEVGTGYLSDTIHRFIVPKQ